MKIGCHAYLEQEICEMRGCFWMVRGCAEVNSTTESTISTTMGSSEGRGEGNGIINFLAVVGLVTIVLLLLMGVICCLLRLRHRRLAPDGVPVDPAVGEREAEKKAKDEAEKKKERQKEMERKREADLEKIGEVKREQREERKINEEDRDEVEVKKTEERRGLLQSFGFACQSSRPGVRPAAAPSSWNSLASRRRGPAWGCREEEEEEEIEMQELGGNGNMQEGEGVQDSTGGEVEETEIAEEEGRQNLTAAGEGRETRGERL